MTPAEGAAYSAEHLSYALSHFQADTREDALTIIAIRQFATEAASQPLRTLEGGLVRNGMRASYRHSDD